MNEHEKVSNVLKRRLSELRTHLVKVDNELHKPLTADSEDQAIELENQEALEVIEKTEITEIHQIEAAHSEYPRARMALAPSAENLSIRDA